VRLLHLQGTFGALSGPFAANLAARTKPTSELRRRTFNKVSCAMSAVLGQLDRFDPGRGSFDAWLWQPGGMVPALETDRAYCTDLKPKLTRSRLI
jgi:hypothetical protein